MDQAFTTDDAAHALTSRNYFLIFLIALNVGIRVLHSDVTWVKWNPSLLVRGLIVLAVSFAYAVDSTLVAGGSFSAAVLGSVGLLVSGFTSIFRDGKVPDLPNLTGQRGNALVRVMFALSCFALAMGALRCAELKRDVNSPAVRTIRELALAACEFYAGDQAAKMGLSPEDAVKALCTADEKLLEPWIQEETAGLRRAGAVAASRFAARGPVLDAGAGQ